MKHFDITQLHYVHLIGFVMNSMTKSAQSQLKHLTRIDCSAVCYAGIKALRPFELVDKSNYANKLNLILQSIRRPTTVKINWKLINNYHDFLFERFLTILLEFAQGKLLGQIKNKYDNNIIFITLITEIYTDWKHLNKLDD